MSLSLFLMRHGKSDWSSPGADHARSLNSRGIEAAQLMGKMLKMSGQLPAQILSSTATRAMTTAEHFRRGAELSLPIEFSDALYDSSVERVIESIQKIEVDTSLMLVGHQPVWADLTSSLIGGGQIAFPTAAIARIDFDCKAWSEIGKRRGLLKWFLQPKFFSKGNF